MERASVAGLVFLFMAASCTPVTTRPQGDVAVTLGRVIEEIQPDEGTTVEFEIRRGTQVVFVETYAVEFSGSDYRTELDTVFLDGVNYEIRATVDTTQATCTVDVDLSSEVELTVSALIRHDCFLEIEETEGWHDDSGEPLPTSVIEEFYGGGHCGWTEVRFIAFGEYFVGDAYLRDPDGVFEPESFVTSRARQRLGLESDQWADFADLEPADFLSTDLDVELPFDDTPLGYMRGVRELFVSPDSDYLYVVSPNGVERWPRVQPHPACA